MRFRFRLRLFVADEYKPLRLVSPFLWLLVIAAFVGQLAFHHYVLPPPKVSFTNFEQPPSQRVFDMLAMGEKAVLSKLLSLRIQAFDNQSGLAIPFRAMDYDALGVWLDRVVALDERAEYPHFMMAKNYALVQQRERQYKAVDWVWRQFRQLPNARWEWMVYVTNMTKYVLNDHKQALEMAQDISARTTAGEVPSWVRQTEAWFLETQDEFEAMAAVLQKRLDDGEVTEPTEFAFLTDRLSGVLKKVYARGNISREELDRRVQTLAQLKADFLAQHDIGENPEDTATEN